MSRLTPWIALGGLTAALTACPARTPSPPPTAAPPIRVPPGCERTQAGEYYHADNPTFRYRGEDDGGTLTLSVLRVGEPGTPPEDGGSTVSLELRRTPEGFVGETRATTFTPAGTACAARFPTQATQCDPAGLTLRTVASTSLDENCAPATSGPAPVWKPQRLLRGAPEGSSPDAGSPDAGPADAGPADAGERDGGASDAGAPR